MLRRFPLLRRTLLRRSFMRRSGKRTKYRQRQRERAYMLFVRHLPCAARELGRCEGHVEADHAGRRGVGQKAGDDTCIPLCAKHHRERQSFSGDFRAWDPAAHARLASRANRNHSTLRRNARRPSLATTMSTKPRTAISVSRAFYARITKAAPRPKRRSKRRLRPGWLPPRLDSAINRALDEAERNQLTSSP